MSVRSKLVKFTEVILRVPPLFVVDELMKYSLGLPHHTSLDQDISSFSNLTIDEVEELSETTYDDVEFYNALFLTCVKFSLSFFGCLAAFCTFVLFTNQLITLYGYLLSVVIVFVSYWTNVSALMQAYVLTHREDGVTSPSVLENILTLNLNNLLDLDGPGLVILQNYLLQFLLGSVFHCIRHVPIGPRCPKLDRLVIFSFLIPSFIASVPLSVSKEVLHNIPLFTVLIPLILVKYVLWTSVFKVVQTIYTGYQHARMFVTNFGLSALVETEWMRLNVPYVLRVFWLLRAAEHALVLVVDHYEVEPDDGSKIATLIAVQTIASMMKSLLVSGCETITAVLGMTSVISFFCHYIGNFFQWILLTEEEEDKSIGTVSAILFYILALQTGLTSLNPEKRFVRLCRNFCLLFTALLHFLHNIVNPVLMSLSASHNPSVHRHMRALGVCLFLIIFPVSLLVYLWSQHTISTWLLAVSAFSIEVIVKVIISLMIYSLFLIDAYRKSFWESLDDYVYYIRAFGNTVEFHFGIFLFFNGAWILLYESGGAIRAVMMCLHAYFNIWCEARAGWSVFMKRRSAVNKINSLPEASGEQLHSLDDVCAICYQEMSSAKITRCNHFFHGVCLRKWLYVQDRCPLCHEILYKFMSDGNKDTAGEEENSNNENREMEVPANDNIAEAQGDANVVIVEQSPEVMDEELDWRDDEP